MDNGKNETPSTQLETHTSATEQLQVADNPTPPKLPPGFIPRGRINNSTATICNGCKKSPCCCRK
ncbi:hypothetical protein QCA50_005742 [Cerrena zonata]|uniref:Uncharacterized protein n=1 Tax=Cerrena zonata TaxID=2478898 RepID=A0AAW0GB37_9APHY